jgi:hypothetical protein
MKKLLLIFFITFGLTGIANADVEYKYSCEVEGSGFYNYSESHRIDLKPSKLTFRIDRDFELYFYSWDDIFSFNFINNLEKTTAPPIRTFFTMNDYEDYQNFNASLADETDIFSNLVYKNGSLALTWMNKDSASLGAYFATCTEELMHVLYEDFYTVTKLRCGDLIVEEPTIEEIEAMDYNNRRAVAAYIDLPPEDPICIEAQKNND